MVNTSIRPTMNPKSPIRLTMKAFLAAAAAARPREPEPDQQVGAEPDQLPAQEQHRVVPGEHQGQHRCREQVEVGEEAGKRSSPCM